jgi:nucleoside-diphosphate-sugar epimerase
MKTALVTGATGFVGRHAISALQSRDFAIHTASSDPLEGSAARHHVCDLLEPDTVDNLLGEVRPTHLLHLAWFAQPNLYWTSEENLRWVSASLHLARAFRRAGGTRLVGAGSCAEYEWTGSRCSEAASRLAPATLYGTSKHALQLVLSAWAREVGMSVAWGRLFFLYGPYEQPVRLVPTVIRAALDKAPIRCTAGTQVRDFQHVADAAGALVALLDSEVTGPVNVASGHAVPVKNVVHAIADRLDASHLVELGALPLAASEPAAIEADVTRLREEVGWRDRFGLAEGLADTIAWWQR